MKKKLLALIFFIPVLAFAENKDTEVKKEIVVINEDKLKELMTDNVPSIERINLLITQSNLEKTKYNQKYSSFLNASAEHNDIDGDVYDNEYDWGYDNPTKKYGVSINQNLPYGVGYELGLYNNYEEFFGATSGSPTFSQYDTNLEAKITLDLWKNLLGYSEKAEILGLEINEKEKTEQAKLEKIKFYNEVRKIYWDLNITNSLINIYESLIKQAETQEENIEDMYNSSVADKGELARARALTNTRKANLESVKYNMEKAKENLANIIPELNDKELVFEFQTYKDVSNEILSCYNKIKTQKETPFDLTSYTKLIDYKEDRLNSGLKSLERYNHPDVKLEARGRALGYGHHINGSSKELFNNDKNDYSVNFNVSMPFGGSYSDTKENEMKVLKMQNNIEKKEIISNINSFHNYFSTSFENLISLFNNQRKYRDNLIISVESMRTKYNQGRVSLNELIQDEDSLFESEVGLVNTSYNIVALMMDYFSIFNEFECDFNSNLE